MRSALCLLSLALLSAGATAQRNINMHSQPNWPTVTGSGAPAITCSSVNYGEPYLDISATPNMGYICGVSGASPAWVQTSAIGGPFLPLTGGTLTGPLTAPSVNNVLSYTNFGAKCDGSTDDSTALNSIGTYAATVTGGKTVTVEFPPNAVCNFASEITTWLQPNLHLEFHGTRLHFTGTGHAIYLHATAPETDNFWLRGIVLQGNSGADYGIYDDSLIARGRLDVTNIQDFTTGCAYLGNMQLMDEVNVSCSSIKATAMGVAQTTTPTNGLILGDTAVSGYFANDRHVNLTVEGTGSGDGVHCIRCTNGNVFTGTSEHGGGVGFLIDSVSNLNTFAGFDSEQNTTEDFQDNGTDDAFINSHSDGLTEVGNSSVRSYLHGGSYNSLSVDASAKYTTLDSLSYNVLGTGSLSVLSASFPTLRNVYNAQTGALAVVAGTAWQVANLVQSTQSSNAAARNWGWLPDYYANGYYCLYESASNTGLPTAGTRTMCFDSSGNLNLVNSAFQMAGNSIIPTGSTLPYVGFKVYSGTGTPTDTCSSTVNNGAIEINATPTAYQCSNATGSYVWSTLGGGGGTTTNSLTGNTSGGAAPGSTFNGATAVTWDYHTLGAAKALGSCTDESATFTPTDGTCYFVTASVSTATPAASAFVVISLTTSSAGSLALTGTTILDGGECGSYISGTTLTLPASESVSLRSDGTNIRASCTQAAGSGTVTDGAGTTTANKMAQSTGTAHVLAYADFPELVNVVAANCNNATGGTGWSLPTSGAPTVACRTGTNIQAGVLQFADSNTAQFQIALPGDYDSAGTVYARIRFTQGTNTTSGQTIIMQMATGCSTTTDDPAFNTAQSFGTATTGTTANTPYDETLSSVTMTGCTAGHTLNVKISRTTDTATVAPNVYYIELTIPRLPVNQAN